MARLRRTNNVTVLTFDEKKRIANVFMLLVEIDLQKGASGTRRALKSPKAKMQQRANRKIKQTLSEQEPSDGIYLNNKKSRMRSSKIALRGLYLWQFTSIFSSNKINFMGYDIDRHHCFIAYT
jgi:hypothetical protein